MDQDGKDGALTIVEGNEEAMAMVQVSASIAGPQADWDDEELRRKRVQGKWRHSLLHAQGPGQELNSRVGHQPARLRTRAMPFPARVDA